MRRCCSLIHIASFAAASACGSSGASHRSTAGTAPTAPEEAGGAAQGAASAEQAPVALEPMLAQVDTGAANPDQGGQTGDDSGLILLDCVPISSSALDLDLPSPLGFVPRESAAWALGTLRVSLLWRDNVGVSPQEAELQLEIAPLATSAELVHRQEANARGDCPDVVELAVGIQIETSDGILREHLQGKLQLTADQDILFLPVAASTLQSKILSDGRASVGTLAASEFEVSGIFNRYGAQGILGATYGEGTAAIGGGLADWPAWNSSWGGGASGRCIMGTAVLKPEERPSVEDVVASVAGANPIQIIDGTGIPRNATLSVTPVMNSACFSPSYEYSPGPMDLLTVEAELELDSDSSNAIRLPARLHATFDRRTLTVNTSLEVETVTLSPEDFVRQYGDWGVDLTGYQGVFLRERESTFILGAVEDYAYFTIVGVKAPGCTLTPMGWSCPDDGSSHLEDVDLADVRFFSR